MFIPRRRYQATIYVVDFKEWKQAESLLPTWVMFVEPVRVGRVPDHYRPDRL